jgi:hypothetical protein
VKEKKTGDRKWTIYDPHADNSDLRDIHVKMPIKRELIKCTQVKRRWAGYGQKSKNLQETHPEAYFGWQEDNDVVYEVEGIVSSYTDDDGNVLYRVRWKGYPPNQDTWEPESHLRFAPIALQEYKKRQRE